MQFAGTVCQKKNKAMVGDKKLFYGGALLFLGGRGGANFGFWFLRNLDYLKHTHA